MKLVVWLIVLTVFASLAWAVGMAAWQYVEVARVVDEAVAATPAGAREGERVDQVRSTILARNRIGLDERAVTIAHRERSLAVSVRWNYSLSFWKSGPMLSIPLAVNRTYSTP